MNAPRILSVGQCGFDHGVISRHLQKHFSATTVRANTHDDALADLHANGVDLVLVNRITDDDGSEGLDLIRSMKADPTIADLPVMLVSDHTSAQNEAMTLGALKGFGKSDLQSGRPLAAIELAILQIR